MSAEELKPCPLCGSNDCEMYRTDCIAIHCNACQMIGPPCDTEEDAARLWNARPVSPADDGGLREAAEAVLAPYAKLTDEALEAGVMMEHGPPKPEKGKALLRLRAALSRAPESDTHPLPPHVSEDYCMCGQHMDSHSPSENHTPVSEADYYRRPAPTAPEAQT